MGAVADDVIALRQVEKNTRMEVSATHTLARRKRG